MNKATAHIHQVIGLSFQIAKAEFKLKNEGSYLGIFWYLLNPILTFALLFFVFSDRLGNTIPEYPIYLLLGIVLFNIFQSATLESTKSIIKEHRSLIKSINFPRESLILSIVLKNLFSHVIEIALCCILLIYMHYSLFWFLFYLPILFFFLLFIYGTALILSSLTVFFVDLDNIWAFAVRLIWLGTPIFYSIGGQMRLFYVNLANPLYYFITATRDLVIYHRMPEMWIVWGVVGFSVFTFICGFFLFRTLNIKAAERI